MDIGNEQSDNANGRAESVDIEQSLLQQFSCMGTCDREELISQLQVLIGSSLTYRTAAFFLDMNNWNLQSAICSYFDVESSVKLPSMALAPDPQASETANIEPNTKFQKSWNVYNNGTDAWPDGCYIQCADGDPLSGCNHYVNCLLPGESLRINVDMVSPAKAGTYQSKWRLCTNAGSYFGDPMWLILTVMEQGTIDLTKQLSLSHLSDSPPPSSIVDSVSNPFRTSHLRRQQDQNNYNDDSSMC